MTKDSDMDYRLCALHTYGPAGWFVTSYGSFLDCCQRASVSRLSGAVNRVVDLDGDILIGETDDVTQTLLEAGGTTNDKGH